MDRRWRTAAVLAALAAAPAIAHEKGGRAMGIVESVTPERIVVRTSDGHEVPFAVTNETRFFTGEKPARAEDVRAGRRVVVHGKRDGEVLRALQVKLGAQPATR